MNIFYLSSNFEKNAQWLDDKRLNKMIVETAQILSTVIRKHGYDSDVLYRPTHINHPCVKWAFSNCGYIKNLLFHYIKEWQYRFGYVHKSYEVYVESLSFSIRSNIKSRPPKVMPDEFKKGSTISAYKKYMKFKWDNDKTPPKWTKRSRPKWSL